MGHLCVHNGKSYGYHVGLSPSREILQRGRHRVQKVFVVNEDYVGAFKIIKNNLA